MPENRLRQVGEDRPVEDTTKSAEDSFLNKVALDAMLLAFKALSQRTIIALGQLFTLLTCLSAFWLWYIVLPNPNSYQLVGLALYGAFLLLLHLVKKKS